MPVLYVLEQGVTISKEGERLIIKKEGRMIKYYHLHNIEQVIIIGRVNITPAVIATLLKREIDTVFLDSNGNYLGRLSPPWGRNSLLRMEHFKKAMEGNFSLSIAREIVRGKIENQRVFLRRINRKGLGLEDIILRLKRIAEDASKGKDLQSLRGFEGTASRLYFQGFGKALEGKFQFKGREKRPPKDPVNSLLSLGYTLLLNRVISSINLVGLDPFIGFFHSIEYGRPSLALDLMEEWRPIIVDAVVVSCFNMGVIKRNDFEKGDDGGFYLTKDGWRKFINQFERKMNEKVEYPNGDMKLPYRSCIEQQVRLLARTIMGEGVYKAAVFR